jgi:hypothetical protein
MAEVRQGVRWSNNHLLESIEYLLNLVLRMASLSSEHNHSYFPFSFVPPAADLKIEKEQNQGEARKKSRILLPVATAHNIFSSSSVQHEEWQTFCCVALRYAEDLGRHLRDPVTMLKKSSASHLRV